MSKKKKKINDTKTFYIHNTHLITPKENTYHKTARRLISALGMQQSLEQLLQCFTLRHDYAVFKFNQHLKQNQLSAVQYLNNRQVTAQYIINVQYAEFATHMLNKVFMPVYQCLPADTLVLWTTNLFLTSIHISQYKPQDKLYQTRIDPKWQISHVMASYLQYCADMIDEQWLGQTDIDKVDSLANRLEKIWSSIPKKDRRKSKVPSEVTENIERYSHVLFPSAQAKIIKYKFADSPTPVYSHAPRYDFKYEGTPQKASTHTMHSSQANTPTLNSKKKLYIFHSFVTMSCNLKKHKVVETYVPLFSDIEHRFIDIPVHKCLTCNRTFVSAETWKLYGQHGIAKSYIPQQESSFDMWNEHSELGSYGYKVGAKGLSVVERQVLIMDLIKHDKMTPYAIERDIVKAINIHENNTRMSDAVADWEDDLKFLGNYILRRSKKNS